MRSAESGRCPTPRRRLPGGIEHRPDADAATASFQSRNSRETAASSGEAALCRRTGMGSRRRVGTRSGTGVLRRTRVGPCSARMSHTCGGAGTAPSSRRMPSLRTSGSGGDRSDRLPLRHERRQRSPERRQCRISRRRSVAEGDEERPQRVGEVERHPNRLHRVQGRIEGHQKAVALGPDLYAVMGRPRRPKESAMLAQELGVALAQVLQWSGGTLDCLKRGS
jgi:hypothetical protein